VLELAPVGDNTLEAQKIPLQLKVLILASFRAVSLFPSSSFPPCLFKLIFYTLIILDIHSDLDSPPLMYEYHYLLSMFGN
jgi:hypothetical protein